MKYTPDVRDGLIVGVLFGFILQFFYQKSLELLKAQTELRVTSYLDNEFLASTSDLDL